MEDFTVLLLRPDYVADNYGQDTYLAHVSAPSVTAAQEKAQDEAVAADIGSGTADIGSGSEDYAVLLVLRGHHSDIRVEAE